MSLTVSSGVVDAISFIGLSKVFTAFMTGNLVFLGLGAASAFPPGGPNLLRVGTAIVAFAAGVFAATELIKRSRAARAGPHGVSLALSGVLLAQLVFLLGWVLVSGRPSTTFATCLAAVAAVAMGMQSGAVGSLGVRGVFTTAATGSVILLAAAAADRPATAAEPARLARVLVCLVAGATVGGLLLVGARTYAPVVPPVATAVALGAWRVLP